MSHEQIAIDATIAAAAGCRASTVDVIFMPMYCGDVTKIPSSDLGYICRQGCRIFEAIEFIHSKGYIHMDIKAQNIFVDTDGKWYLGDFGSMILANKVITSSTWMYWPFEASFVSIGTIYIDWFMFLVFILIETLKDRKSYQSYFFAKVSDSHVDKDKVINYVKRLISKTEIEPLISKILTKLETSDTSYTSNNNIVNKY